MTRCKKRRVLRGYQRRALAYTRKHQGHPALFLEMRLGKTLTAIRRIVTYTPQADRLRVLVVAPNSALGGWETELQSEGVTSIARLTGTRKQRLALLHKNLEWNLLNKEGHRALPEVANIAWDAVVLDESTFIKNPKSKVSKFYTKHFRAVPHRWILTGTPNPESELDFFQQFLFLDGGQTFGKNYWQFRAYNYYKAGFKWRPKIGVTERIHQKVSQRAMILHRKDVNLQQRKVYEPRYIELPPEIRKTYTTAEEEFILEYGGEELQRTVYAVAKYNWLRQLTGGYLEKEAVWKGKAAELVALLHGELAGQQVVVWGYYVHELVGLLQYLVQHRIKDVAVIHGGVSTVARETLVKRFQSGATRVLLVQPNCAQFGVDLSAASVAIYYSNALGYLARAQTEDRILSVAEHTPLLYIDLLVKDTVDVDIYALLRDKERRSVGFLNACKLLQQRRTLC